MYGRGGGRRRGARGSLKCESIHSSTLFIHFPDVSLLFTSLRWARMGIRGYAVIRHNVKSRPSSSTDSEGVDFVEGRGRWV